MSPSRRVTAADIARATGVSRATVGFVLNDTPGQTISETTRRRVLGAALDLGYRPNVAARALARGRSDIILLVVPPGPSYYTLRRYLEAFSAVLADAGYSLVTWTPSPEGKAPPLWERVDTDLVIGLAPFGGEQLAALRAAGVTKVLPTGDRPPEVGTHRILGAPEQVDHLYALGHRQLVFAAPGDVRRTSLVQDRVRAVRAQAALHGLRPVVDVTVDGPDATVGRAVGSWLEEGCTGVVAFDDDTAAAVLGAAIDMGIAVPAQLSVVGHDDSPLAALVRPTLTSVRLDLETLAREMAGYALQELGVDVPAPEAGPDLTELVERESTGQARRS